ncbi:MAG: hypothetical protein COB54_05285 [Alphaproteobacteria bacterium]|nr:MAG: hypothetical protein COB54_05285 [Alphaproteobacteria bacterium]
MATVLLRVQGAESTLLVTELTIDRILAEARAVGLKEFAVMRNGEEVINPDELVVQENDVFVILPADYEDVEITVDVANDSDDDPEDAPDNNGNHDA